MLLFFLDSQFSRLLRVTLSVFVFSVILSACGGGGSSSGTPDTIANPLPEEPEVVPAPTVFNVSGTIQIPTGSLADDDSMESGEVLLVSNNSIGTAQVIINPSATGGYVSSGFGFYQDNRFFFDADPADFYSVSLLKDQVISLVSFPAESSSLASPQNVTMAVYDSVGTLLNSTTSTPDSKSMTITASGDYFIEVRADQGPTLYLLTVSQEVTTTNQTLLMAADFVPGEVLVKLKEPDTESLSSKSTLTYSQANDRAKGQLALIDGLSHIGGSSKHGMRMQIDLSVPRSVMAQSLVNVQTWPDEIQQKWETLTYIESLKARDDVEWAEPNYVRKAFLTPTDPDYSKQWHYSQINLPEAWEVAKGDGITVAVIDTGIASLHTDLAANISGGYDFVSNISIAGDGDGYDPNPEDVGGNFHGSHVAGTVAAVEGNAAGGVGVAFNAKVMPLRVLGIDGSGNDADIAQAILYAAKLANGSGSLPNQAADIINLSLGGAGFSNSLESAVNAAEAEGVIIIAAAGNENSSSLFYPAAFTNVISVSAVGQDKELAPYSNFGSTISVSAPGGNMLQNIDGDPFVDGIYSTINASDYAWFEGTSMAAPHVAGVAALMKSVDGGLNASTFKSKLELGQLTDDLGAAGRDDSFGYGLINASKAMAAAGIPIPAFLSINPPSISFDGLSTSTTISMTKGGSTGTIEITSVSDVDNSNMADATWLTVTEQSVDGNKLGSYLVTIDRTGLPLNSTHLGTITIDYEKNSGAQPSKTISVLMTVPDPSKVATVGTLFVGLIERSVQEAAEDAVNQEEDDVLIEIFDFQTAVENQGTYTYSFNDIPIGDYYVFASTNMDQDGIVSDYGEAQGDYPVVGAPTLITVSDADITGLNFTVNYLNFVEGQSTELNAKPEIIRMIPDEFLPENSEIEPQEILKQN